MDGLPFPRGFQLPTAAVRLGSNQIFVNVPALSVDKFSAPPASCRVVAHIAITL